MALSVLNSASHHYSVDKLGTERVIVVTKSIYFSTALYCMFDNLTIPHTV